MIAEMEYRETLEEIGAVAFALSSSCGEKGDYGNLVQQFENTAGTLVSGVNALINEICDDRDVAHEAGWQHAATYLADELVRYPGLLLEGPCPAGYETLRLLYCEWAEACEGLGWMLRALLREQEESSVHGRICRVEEELSVVIAHNKARAIYLRELRQRNE